MVYRQRMDPGRLLLTVLAVAVLMAIFLPDRWLSTPPKDIKEFNRRTDKLFLWLGRLVWIGSPLLMILWLLHVTQD